ncbi:MAG: adenylosuccinate synthetase [Tepidisphaeraceae bacterium]
MNRRHAITVIGLAFGDCGKGSIVDFLTRTRDAHTVVRFNGGPQAGHNVVTPDGRHHTFSQFGSGTFVPGVRTLLSRFMLIEPYALFNEAAHLQDVGLTDSLDRLFIDARCPVITPSHQAANRLRELARGDGAHGTCGLGVGETTQDIADHPDLIIHARDLADRPAITRKLRAIRDLKADQLHDAINALRSHPSATFSIDTLLTPTWIEAAADNYAQLAACVRILDPSAVHSILLTPGTLIFEGAQGVLLDESLGFHPYTTWSNTTCANAEQLLRESAHDGTRIRIGVLRCYYTRHGPGPFVTETPALRLSEPHNADAGCQGRFRNGVFDTVAARYALAASPVDALAITHLDRIAQLPSHVCAAYREVYPAEPPANDGLFIHNGDLITDIRLPEPADFGHLTRLSAQLRDVRPVYTPLPNGHLPSFLDMIDNELRSPVLIQSFGPTALDKRLVPRVL